MRTIAIILPLLLIGTFGLVASPSAQQDNGLGSPPALPAGKAPPLLQPGPLAEPRSRKQVGLPQALTNSAIPKGSPVTPAAVALGKRLFFDSRLSGDGTVSCASCHNPIRAFTDGRPTSIGFHGCVGQRNSPTILNAIYNKSQFWDGRAATLEAQAALPITNPCEMGSASVADAVSRIEKDREYRLSFRSAYDRGPNETDMLRALATYESGQLKQVDTAAINGDLSVLGRFLLTKKSGDTASFKTPDIRNVMVTAPYFHDGSQQTLWDVIDHYNKGDGIKNPWLDTDMQPLALTDTEIDDLVAFMAALTSSPYGALAEKEFARQRAIANVTRPQRDTKRAFGPKPKQPPLPH
jgi:cytochrome c peroxidase